MKIDIEGSEFAIFNDDQRWLNLVDQIAMEVHTLVPISIIDCLNHNGFDAFITDNNLQKQNRLHLKQRSGYIYASRTQ